MTRFRLAWVVLVFWMGCAPSGKDDSDPPAPEGGHTEVCGDASPVIDELLITDNGPTEFGEGDAAETWPALRIEASVSDEDADLDWYTFRVWYDGLPDGSVDTTEDPFELKTTVSDEDCSVPVATVGTILAVNGNPPPSTELEFGVVVLDAEQHESAPAVTTVMTPDPLE